MFNHSLKGTEKKHQSPDNFKNIVTFTGQVANRQAEVDLWWYSILKYE